MQTLNQLVTYLTEEKQNSDEAIREILRSNHPIFAQLRKLFLIPYRVFFINRTEFSQWLRAARLFDPVEPDQWDSPEYEEWIKNETGKPSKLLKLSTAVFDQKGDLVIYTAQQWQNNWISLTDYQPPPEEEPGPDSQIADDDVPF